MRHPIGRVSHSMLSHWFFFFFFLENIVSNGERGVFIEYMETGAKKPVRKVF